MIETLLSYQARNNEQLNLGLTACHTKKSSSIPELNQRDALRVTLGGKRARPFLFFFVYITGEMLSVAPQKHLDTPASATEMAHAYSLIHDDLPAMDDDELRRGHQTCHIKYDEATVILTGVCNFKQTRVYHTCGRHIKCWTGKQSRSNDSTPSRKVRCTRYVYWQALDIEAENRSVTPEELEEVHRNKTGALMKSDSFRCVLAAGENAWK